MAGNAGNCTNGNHLSSHAITLRQKRKLSAAVTSSFRSRDQKMENIGRREPEWQDKTGHPRSQRESLRKRKKEESNYSGIYIPSWILWSEWIGILESAQIKHDLVTVSNDVASWWFLLPVWGTISWEIELWCTRQDGANHIKIEWNRNKRNQRNRIAYLDQPLHASSCCSTWSLDVASHILVDSWNLLDT